MQLWPAGPRPRRLAPALLLAAVVLCACRGGADGVRIEPAVRAESATPARVEPVPDGVVRLAVPEGLRDLVEIALGDADLRISVRAVPEDSPAEIRLVPTRHTGSDPVLRRWSVATSAARIDQTGTTAPALQDAATHARLFAAPEHIALVRAFFEEGAGPVPVASEQIPARLAAAPDSLALVPVDAITTDVRALALDGVDPVRAEGDLAAYPLVTRGRPAIESDLPHVADVGARLMAALQRPEPPAIRIALTGDVIPARCVYDQMRRMGDWTAPFQAMGDRLHVADITVGSLDAAISDKGTPIGCRETFSLLAPPQVVDGLVQAGFDVMSVATNHTKDCGASGPCGDATFLDTLRLLTEAGIRPAGGGRTLSEAREPVIVTVHGVRFAFLAYDDIAAYYHAGASSPGAAPLDSETLRDDIRAARARADVVIVLPHWGEEYTPIPTERQRRVGALAIESGAALVAGNHPHVVQAAEPRPGGYIAYALGNFVFDQDWSQETMEGALLEVTFHGARMAAVRFVPYRIDNRLRPTPLTGDAATAVLARIMGAAAALE
jgi:poly-gamma-glutamate capsule biosynthesis protein CapA/YwtB (metallophosphatase superfamily)